MCEHTSKRLNISCLPFFEFVDTFFQKKRIILFDLRVIKCISLHVISKRIIHRETAERFIGYYRLCWPLSANSTAASYVSITRSAHNTPEKKSTR